MKVSGQPRSKLDEHTNFVNKNKSVEGKEIILRKHLTELFGREMEPNDGVIIDVKTSKKAMDDYTSQLHSELEKANKTIDELKETCLEYSNFVRNQTDEISELKNKLQNVLKANKAEFENISRNSDDIVIRCNKDYYKWQKEKLELKKQNAEFGKLIDSVLSLLDCDDLDAARSLILKTHTT